MRRRALLFGSLALVACGAKPRPALPPAPQLSSAADLLPADLDVVVRLDLAKVKAVLGAVALSAVAGQVLARGKPDAGSSDLVVSSLLEADQVYLGYRPDPFFAPLDRVLALQGHFSPLMAPPRGFSAATDVGADLRHWDATLPRERTETARIYAQGERVRAFVSEAEIDAVERALSGLSRERRLQPPEEGTLSLAARPQLLRRVLGSGSVGDLVSGAERLHAVVELESDGARLSAELVLANAQEAERLANAGQQLLARSERFAHLHVSVSAQAERLLLRATLGRAELAPLLGCFGLGNADAEAACPW